MEPEPVLVGLILGSLLCAGCAEISPLEWKHLAGHRAEVHSARDEYVLAHDEVVRIEREGADRWVETVVLREEWSWDPDLEVWSRPLPVAAIGNPLDGGFPYRLTGPHGEYEGLMDSRLLQETFRSFAVLPETVLLSLEEGSEPPAEVVLGINASHVGASAGCNEVRGRRFSGEGFVVWPGERCELRIDAPRGSVLRWATGVEQAMLRGGTVDTTFRVLLDDELLYRYVAQQRNELRWHEVALPEVSDGRLVFAVNGPFGYTAFLCPVVGPASDDVRLSTRPARPDIVVFLADTFRADNLALYGSELGLTPNIDDFAERCLRFQRAWSVCTYTLSAHASMFTGMFPPQNMRVDWGSSLSHEADTIAEYLSSHGYRTGAITDSVMVSRTRGLHQGFHTFDERKEGFDSTLDRVKAFLDADDGRPTFLFVQTYATHAPYRVSTATKEAHSGRFDMDARHKDIAFDLRRQQLSSGLDPTDPDTAEALEGLRNLYRGSVIDLDIGFGRFFDELEARGVLDNGYLIFTSDHGEAFGEHGAILHTDVGHEELLRIPLLVYGGTVEPRTVQLSASLIDFAPTIADMAGLPGQSPWEGVSWLELDTERPIFAFESLASDDSTCAVIDDGRKVVLEEGMEGGDANRIRFAYDLNVDPREEADALSGGHEWPKELLRDHAGRIEALMTPVLPASNSAVDAQQAGELEDLGYTSD